MIQVGSIIPMPRYVGSSTTCINGVKVLRQFAVTAGLGRRRPKPKRETKAKLGTEGEDIVPDDGNGATIKLRQPTRFGPGTVKAAAWQVCLLRVFACLILLQIPL